MSSYHPTQSPHKLHNSWMSGMILISFLHTFTQYTDRLAKARNCDLIFSFCYWQCRILTDSWFDKMWCHITVCQSGLDSWRLSASSLHCYHSTLTSEYVCNWGGRSDKDWWWLGEYLIHTMKSSDSLKKHAVIFDAHTKEFTFAWLNVYSHPFSFWLVSVVRHQLI